MPDSKERPSLETLKRALPGDSIRVIDELHAIAVRHGCTYKVQAGPAENAYTITYSGRSFELHIAGGKVALTAEFDIRGLLDFYRHTADTVARELLFHAVEVCRNCDFGHCCGMVDRTITLGGKRKTLCGPWRHGIRLEGIHAGNLEPVKAIAEMVFRYFTPAMNRDIENEVSYTVEHRPGFVLIGLKHAVNTLSVKVEDFVKDCLATRADGTRRIDELLSLASQADGGRYVGITADFVSGSCYSFILGVPCDEASLPTELPEGVVRMRVQPGDYAVYNSSAGVYRSIWKHFTERFYDAEHKGYDIYRLPFEHYDRAGCFSDVCIPVSAEMPRKSGRYTRVVYTPDIRIAGKMTCAEKDHPLYAETTGLPARLLDLFPEAERVVQAFIHAHMGKPMLVIDGVEVGKFDTIPDELDEFTLRGGYWNVVGYRHFTGLDLQDYEVERLPYTPRVTVDSLAHPRAFICYNYADRGGYSETASPMRKMGKRIVELVERPACKLVGKEETPQSIVTEADFRAFENMENAVQKGSTTLVFGSMHYEKHSLDNLPVVKGAEVTDFPPLPAGMKAYTFAGGKYVRVTETLPNGEYGWEMAAYLHHDLEKETGYTIDKSRLFFVRQTGYGKEFATYVPVK